VVKDMTRIKVAKLLESRLERISQDSIWAHRSSGIRGSLLNMIYSSVEEITEDEKILFDELIFKASEILKSAGKDLVT